MKNRIEAWAGQALKARVLYVRRIPDGFMRLCAAYSALAPYPFLLWSETTEAGIGTWHE